MRINDKYAGLNLDKLQQSKNSKNAKSGSESEKVSGTADDTVSISSKAKEVSSLTSKIKASPDVRTERVDELKSQIQNGTYDVQGRKVAEKMVNLAVDDLF